MSAGLTAEPGAAVAKNSAVQISIKRFELVFKQRSIALQKKFIPAVFQVLPLSIDYTVKRGFGRITGSKQLPAFSPFGAVPDT